MSFEFTDEVGGVSSHVEMAVSTEVESDDLFLSSVWTTDRLVDGTFDHVVGLRGRDDALTAGKLHACLKAFQLLIGTRLDVISCNRWLTKGAAP